MAKRSAEGPRKGHSWACSWQPAAMCQAHTDTILKDDPTNTSPLPHQPSEELPSWAGMEHRKATMLGLPRLQSSERNQMSVPGFKLRVTVGSCRLQVAGIYNDLKTLAELCLWKWPFNPGKQQPVTTERCSIALKTAFEFQYCDRIKVLKNFCHALKLVHSSRR